jgi:hypothetical protein
MRRSRQARESETARKRWVSLPADRWNLLSCSAWGKNSNSSGLSRDLWDGLSDGERIGEAEESEVAWLNQGFFRAKYKKQLKVHGI